MFHVLNYECQIDIINRRKRQRDFDLKNKQGPANSSESANQSSNHTHDSSNHTHDDEDNHDHSH